MKMMHFFDQNGGRMPHKAFCQRLVRTAGYAVLALAAAISTSTSTSAATPTADDSKEGVPQAVTAPSLTMRIDALSTASRIFPYATDMTVRVGIVRVVRPAPAEPIIGPSIEKLKMAFGADKVHVKDYPLRELAQAIRRGEVDVFMSSAGFYRRMVEYGARDLVTVVSHAYPDPNHSDGTTFVVRADSPYRDIADLKGARLVTSTPTGFTGLQVPFGEIHRAGFNVEKFFSTVQYVGDGRRVRESLDLLREGMADVGFFRLCYMDRWFASHPEDRKIYRVIHRKDGPDEACMRSTDLYPTWTMATTGTTDPRLSRLVTRVLLEIAPIGEDGLYWGVATDYTPVDQLFRDLRIGPYEYLRHWTMERVVREYWPWLLIALMVLVGLLLHSVRVTQLVRVRTSALNDALKEQKTLQMRTQLASERISKLEKTGLMGQLSSIVAHEMRQPLSAISLYTYALKRMFARPGAKIDPAMVEDVLTKLQTETARADAIVTKVRSYAKSDKLHRERIYLDDPVQTAIGDLRASERYRANIRTGRMEKVLVMADPFEMQLVASNLIKNALEVLQNVAGGEVFVRVEAIADKAVLTVSDNGPEMSKEDFAQIQSFSRKSGKREGLGLGLSIVNGIVQAHGGTMTFQRRLAGGLTVIVALPKATATEAADASNKAAAPGAGTEEPIPQATQLQHEPNKEQ